MNIKLGPSSGNSGAVIRFGRHLDRGVWLHTWNFRKLWLNFYLRGRRLNLGPVCIHF